MVTIEVKEKIVDPANKYKKGDLWIHKKTKSIVMCSDEQSVDKSPSFGGLCIASDEPELFGLNSIYWAKSDFDPFVGEIIIKSE